MRLLLAAGRPPRPGLVRGLWQWAGGRQRRRHGCRDHGKVHSLKRPATDQQFKIEIRVLKKEKKGKEPARIGGCTANCQRLFVKGFLTDSRVVRGA